MTTDQPESQMMIPLSDTPRTVSDSASDTSDGGRLSVRLNRQQNDDLLTIMQGAGDQSEAVRYALNIAADICRSAWAVGYVPPRVLPRLTAYQVVMPDRTVRPVRVGQPDGGV